MSLQWHVVYSKPRSEKKLNEALREKGFETYLPLLRLRRQWSDRVKQVDVPAFASYVFVRANLEVDSLTIRKIPYCVHIVHSAGEPAIIADADMEMLKIAVAEFADSIIAKDTSGFSTGQKVRVRIGPFAGRDAIVEQIQGETHLLLHFPALNKTIQIRVPVEDIEGTGENLLTPT